MTRPDILRDLIQKRNSNIMKSSHSKGISLTCNEVTGAGLKVPSLVSDSLRLISVISAACEEGPGVCSFLITIASVLIILGTLPLSLLFTVKVVQEYERAVIFRLGRLLTGGARGPGVFFIIPCVDIYEKIDMRTKTYEIPPQEVRLTK